MIPLGRATVFVLTPTTVREHGTDVPVWDDAPVSRVRVDGCLVDALPAQEVLLNRDATQASWRVLLPMVDAHGEPYTIDATNRVEWANREHDIVGEPLHHPSPSGTLDHWEVLATSWKG